MTCLELISQGIGRYQSWKHAQLLCCYTIHNQDTLHVGYVTWLYVVRGEMLRRQLQLLSYLVVCIVFTANIVILHVHIN